MKCTATSKRTRGRCGANAMTGRTVCYHHGGRSPVGIASATYRHGAYSALPGPIHETYLKVRADPDFLSVADELHVLRALAAHLAGGLGVDVVAVRREVGSAWDGLQVAKVSRSPEKVRESMERLEQAIAGARQTATKVDELIVMFDTIRKLSDTETKRTVLAKEMLTRGQAQHFAGLVQLAVRQAVEALADEADRRTVLAAFTDNMLRLQAGGLG